MFLELLLFHPLNEIAFTFLFAFDEVRSYFADTIKGHFDIFCVKHGECFPHHSYKYNPVTVQIEILLNRSFGRGVISLKIAVYKRVGLYEVG